MYSLPSHSPPIAAHADTTLPFPLSFARSLFTIKPKTQLQFGLNVDQALMESLFTAITSRNRTLQNGTAVSLADLGYTDVGLDDGWQACGAGSDGGYHNASGYPIVNTTRFPDMRAMTDSAHSQGLRMGWYGNNCWCADKKWALNKFQADVQALIDFNFDSVKYDGCGAELDMPLWYDLLNHTSPKPITIENCNNMPWWPEPPRKPTEPAICPWHLFRTSTDVQADYGVVMGVNLASVLQFSDKGLSFPGCW